MLQRVIPWILCPLATIALAAPARADVAPTPHDTWPDTPDIECSYAAGSVADDPCPGFQTCRIVDRYDEVRATFRARMIWWDVVTRDRMLAAIATCRSPDEGRVTGTFGPGDAPLEVHEIGIPDRDGDVSWRLLGRAERGEMACEGFRGPRLVCAAVHVNRSLVVAWELDPKKVPVASTELRVDTAGLAYSIHKTPRIRQHEGRYQIWLDEPEGWADLVPASDPVPTPDPEAAPATASDPNR